MLTILGFPFGIIPACAGSTADVSSVRCSARDHPRMCGEHLTENEAHRAGEGSSPHVRGARVWRPNIVVENGIIPACAGSTEFVQHPAEDMRDHPRMCGEHVFLPEVS